MIDKKYKGIKPICPRCLSKDTRADEKHSFLKCKRCGYPGHWKQFFEDEKVREEVQQLFEAGKIEGDPLLGSAEKPIK